MTDAELFQRLMHLQTLLELLPKKMWWMKLDLDRLYGSGRVASLGGKVAHAYLWLLGRMWDRGGYIPADDRIIAGALMIDVATWKRTYKPFIEPMLVRLQDGSLGDIFSQKTLVDLMIEQAEKAMANKAKTSKASASRRTVNPAKSKQQPDDTKTVTVEPDVDRDVDRDETVTSSATETVTVHPLAPAYKGPGERPINQAGDARPSADASALRSPALLRSKLVTEGRATGSSLFERINAAKGEH